MGDHSETKGHVAYEFAEVLKNLWSSQFKSISPSDLKQMVGRFKVAFAGRDQQDSHEFCSKLLEWLHEDTNKEVRPSKEPEQNFRDSRDKGAAVTHWRNYLERNQSIIVQLFCGQTRSVLSLLPGGVGHLQRVHQPHLAPAGNKQQDFIAGMFRRISQRGDYRGGDL